MKKHLSICGTFLSLLFFSCRSGKEVRYVYVNPPQTISQPKTTTLSQSSYTNNTPTQSSYNNYTPTQNSYTNHTGDTEIADSFEEVEDATIDGDDFLRGYGEGRSNDYIAARNLAISQAKSHIISKFGQFLEDSSDRNSETINEITNNKNNEGLKQKFLGFLGRFKTIKRYSKRGATNEYAICIEVSINDIKSKVKELLEDYEKKQNK